MQLLTYRVKEWNWLLWAWFCNKLVWSNHVLLIEASLLAAVMHYVLKCHMWFECKSCIISSQLYIHPIIFFKQNPWKKSEDTPANFTLGIYSIFKELLTLLLAQLITQTQDFVLNVNLNTFPQCKTTYNRSTLQKTEQIPDGFLSFRKRERNVLWSTWTNNARLILITSV